MNINLNEPFAANSPANEHDMIQMKKALNRLGYYNPLDGVGITGLADAAIFTALKIFQDDYGLPSTGTARPDDDDETIRLLNRALSQKEGGSYIWRTVEDDRVRSAHAAYNRTIREWANAPDPGEDFNCRCWAEPLPDNILRGIPDKELTAFFLRSEDNVSYMYRDTKGHVTVGIGKMLPSAKTAEGIPFYVIDAGRKRPATSTEIQQAFAKVKARPYGQRYGASTFNPETNPALDKLYISPAVALKLKEEHLLENVRSLREKIKDFNELPTPARQALVDMEYNLGTNKFTAQKWPTLFKAINVRDWEKAARESNRLGIAPSRNADTFNLFMAAKAY